MTRETIHAGGRDRSYLHIAPTTPNADAPLLLALHGTTQNGDTMRRFSGHTLDELAERIGADLVYLNGHRRAWNDGRITKITAAQKIDIDDVAFVSAVVKRFRKPTIAIGYSNGGQLLHRVVRERHGLLAGAVFIAAALPVEDDFALSGQAPDAIPTLHLHGTADPVVPYEGGETRLLGMKRGAVRSARDSAESYAPPIPPVIRRDGGVERADWGTAGSGTAGSATPDADTTAPIKVRLVTQFGTGHVVPNLRTTPARRFVGPSHQDLDTGTEVESFFSLGRAA
jgi:polyhydroxybutyrate depolymerase